MPTVPLTMPKFAYGRAPQTEEELWWSMRAFFGVTIPRTPTCAHHVTPWHAFTDAYYARSPVALWIGSRGFGGKSFQLSSLSVAESTFLNAQISLLGGSGAQSLNIHEHTDTLWFHPTAPRQLLAGDRTKYDTHMIGQGLKKGHIRSLMASQTSVRGPHPQRLRLDEIDEMNLDLLRAAQGQPMRKHDIETQTVMSSTWQHPDGTVTAMRNEAKEKGWPIFEWCWRETSNPIDGWLQPDEVERKRLEIPKAMWDSEYELQEPSFEGRSFDTDILELVFGYSLQGKSYSGDKPVMFMQRQDGHFYMTGIDWAKEVDKTVVTTFDITDPVWICVAWQQFNKMPWHNMVGRAMNQWLYYGGDCVHDKTGIGNVVEDIIIKELNERNLGHFRRKLHGHVMPGGAAKNAFYAEYVAGIEQQKMGFPMIRYAYDEHRYTRDEDLYGNGHVPDSVSSAALAWSRRAASNRIVVPVTGQTRSASNWVIPTS